MNRIIKFTQSNPYATIRYTLGINSPTEESDVLSGEIELEEGQTLTAAPFLNGVKGDDYAVTIPRGELSLYSIVGETYLKDGIPVICLYNEDGFVIACDTHDMGYYYNGIDSNDASVYVFDVTSTEGGIVFEWGGYGTSGFASDQTVGAGITNTETNLAISEIYDKYNSDDGGVTIWTALLKLREDRGSDNWFIPSFGELELLYNHIDKVPNLGPSADYLKCLWSSCAISSTATDRSCYLGLNTGDDFYDARYRGYSCRAFTYKTVEVGDTVILDGIECFVVAVDVEVQGSEKTNIAIDKNYDLGKYINYVGQTQDGYTITRSTEWRWGGNGTEIGTSIEAGYGLQNTNICINNSIALTRGNSTTNTSYPLLWQGVKDFRSIYGDDWFVPSRGECDAYINSIKASLSYDSSTGADRSSRYMMTSSEHSWDPSTQVYLNTNFDTIALYKYGANYVRLCRVFSNEEI